MSQKPPLRLLRCQLMVWSTLGLRVNHLLMEVEWLQHLKLKEELSVWILKHSNHTTCQQRPFKTSWLTSQTLDWYLCRQTTVLVGFNECTEQQRLLGLSNAGNDLSLVTSNCTLALSVQLVHLSVRLRTPMPCSPGLFTDQKIAKASELLPMVFRMIPEINQD